MSDAGWNREAAERAEQAARERGWLRPSTCKRPRLGWFVRLLRWLGLY